MKRLLVLLAALGLLALGNPIAVAQADRDCPDFDSQEEAQDYFEDNGGDEDTNVDNLDADGDGIACETLASEDDDDDDSIVNNNTYDPFNNMPASSTAIFSDDDDEEDAEDDDEVGVDDDDDDPVGVDDFGDDDESEVAAQGGSASPTPSAAGDQKLPTVGSNAKDIAFLGTWLWWGGLVLIVAAFRFRLRRAAR